MKKLFSLLLLGLTLGAGAVRAEKFVIDPVHSDVSFKVRHLMVSKVSGRFDKFTGEFFYDAKDSSKWSAKAVIDAASINTANEGRDGHLKSADFFDTAKYPTLTFVSSRATDVKDNKAKLHGSLTLHGITKPVILDLEILGVGKGMKGEQRAGFEATGKINRKDFGIVWNKVLETGGMAVGEEVEIAIRIEGVAE